MTPGSASPLLLDAAAGGYQISRSLRFRLSASAYLNRTPSSAGNRRTWTWSGWAKRGAFPSAFCTLFNAGTVLSGNTGFFGIRWTANQTLDVTTDSTDLRQTTQVFRDPSAWYHIVVAVDTTQATGANRVKVYVNGSEVTSFVTSNDPAQNLDTAVNNNVIHEIGRTTWSANGHFDGYLADVYFIDSQALTPSSFGETDLVTGVWKPKRYTGTYGTNGFYLNFSDNSAATAAAIGKDSSGNGNNFTPNNIVVSAGATSYSGYFNGSAYVQTPTSTNLALGSGDFTVEMWFKRTGGPTQQALFAYDGNDPYFEFDNSNMRMIINGVDIAGPTVISSNVWYHVAWVRVSGQIRIYLNGTLEVSATSAGALTDNIARIGMRRDGTTPFTGYISNLRMVKGTAVYTSNFTPPTSPLTAISGTQLLTLQSATIVDNSTNAFALTNSSTTVSSSEQPFPTASSIDSIIDTPTPYDDGENGRGNYCVLSPAFAGAGTTLSNGNLTATLAAANAFGSVSNTVGKWYFEVTMGSISGAYVGVIDSTFNVANSSAWTTQARSYASSGSKYDGSSTSYGASYTQNDIIGVAYDLDAGTITFYKNGVSQGTAFTTLSGKEWKPFVYDGTSGGTFHLNFGQRPFTYTPPSGYKALNTQNLSTPTILKPNAWFDVKLDTGANIKTTAEATFSGDELIWIKDRANANNHQLIDTVRGATNVLQSNTTSVDTTYSTPTGNSVGWVWKEGATPGFDIVTYTGPVSSAAQNVAHNLGVKPEMMIVKARNLAGRNWAVYHKELGATQCLRLNLTNAAASVSTYWNNTEPTSTQFTVGTDNDTNANTYNYVAYLFAGVEGFSKFGKYTGNGSADGPFVFCGFRPRYVLVKNASSGVENWWQHDTSREPYNTMTSLLAPDSNTSEVVNTQHAFDVVSNGFKIRTNAAGANSSSQTIIFAAFAENPFKYALAR